MTVGASGTPVGALVGGKYRIVRLLAQGGMGVIYEAHHAVVRRRFAIKFLRRDLAERREILTRFQREAEAAGALENENVAAAVDFGISDDGMPYIVMEYLVGESVGALLEREGRLSAPARLRSGGAGLPRRRSGARRRHRPPRPQAAQPVPLPARRRDGPREGARLRRRQAAGHRGVERGDGHRHVARHRRVHVARASARREDGRPAGRRVRAGRDPLRAPVGAEAAPRRFAERHPAPHRDAAGGAAGLGRGRGSPPSWST